jgi:magnesium transporter
MKQEERTALLNNVAPDDRTLLPGELPANKTRHLLTRLSQEERAVAVILLGYHERSIGRLMTPDYLLYCGGTDLVFQYRLIHLRHELFGLTGW